MRGGFGISDLRAALRERMARELVAAVPPHPGPLPVGEGERQSDFKGTGPKACIARPVPRMTGQDP